MLEGRVDVEGVIEETDLVPGRERVAGARRVRGRERPDLRIDERHVAQGDDGGVDGGPVAERRDAGPDRRRPPVLVGRVVDRRRAVGQCGGHALSVVPGDGDHGIQSRLDERGRRACDDGLAVDGRQQLVPVAVPAGSPRGGQDAADVGRVGVGRGLPHRAGVLARRFDRPVVVMENLSYIRERLDYGRYMNRRLHSWAFARLQARVEDKAREAGISVEYVNPAYTSQTCHECGHLGRRPEQAEFRCTNDDCWVSEYQADINAAANIVGRVNPWGESLPVKSIGDDSPRDGSGSDTATTHRETSETPSQMTLSAYHGSKPSTSNENA